MRVMPRTRAGKTVLVLWLCIGVFGFGVIAAQNAPPREGDEAPRDEDLAERARLMDRALSLFEQGQVPEALAAGEALLAIQRKIAGDDDNTAILLGWLAERHLDIDDLAAAQNKREQQRKTLTALYGERDWRLAEVNWALKHLELLGRISAADRAELVRARALNDAVLAAIAGAEYDRADKLLGESLAVRQRLLPDPHPDVAASTSNAGYLREKKGDFDGAKRLYERALEIFERTYPRDHCPQGHPELATCLSRLGHMSCQHGNYAAARTYYEQALDMCKRLYAAAHYPQGHPELATGLNNLGHVLMEQGDYTAARKLYLQALEMRKGLYSEEEYPQGHVELASSLNNLGALYKAEGSLGAAQDYLEQALEMRKQLYPEDKYPQGHPELATSLSNLGSVLDAQGDRAAARTCYEQAFACYQRFYTPDQYPQGHPELATSLNNQGTLLFGQGDLDGARDCYEQALAMRKRLYPETVFPQGHPDLATSLQNLGELLAAQQDPRAAKAYYEEALAMRERLFPKNLYPHGHAGLAISLHSLGELLQAQGDFARALAYHEQAFETLRDLYPQDKYPQGHPHLAISLGCVGSLLCWQGRFAEAQEYFTQALDMRRRLYPENQYPQGHPDVLRSMEELAMVQVASGNVSGAMELLPRAARMQQAVLERFFAQASGEAMELFLGTQVELVDPWATLATAHDAAMEPAYRAALTEKNVVFDALLRQRQFARLAAADVQIAEQAATARMLRQQLADLALRPATPENQLRQQRLAAEASSLESALIRRVSEAMGDAPTTVPDLKQLGKKIPPGAALVDIVRYRPCTYETVDNRRRRMAVRYAAFIVRDEAQTMAFIDLGPAEEIDQLVAALRQAVVAAPRELRVARELEVEQQYHQAAAALARRVFRPFTAHLAEIKTIYLCPAGELNRVPFEGLIDSAGHYLAESYAFAYLTSGTDLLRNDEATSAAGTIVLAAPDYNLAGQPEATRLPAGPRRVPAAPGQRSVGVRGLSWDKLPGTQGEAEQIAALLGSHSEYGPVQAFVGGEALEGLLKRLAPPRVLHLATHGFYLEEQAPPESDLLSLGGSVGNAVEGGRAPRMSSAARLRTLRSYENPLLRSGIVLAGANRLSDQANGTANEDGWVTAEEICLLNLWGTELVVLSACETGLGDVKRGQGVAGLRQAFLYAGARTLVTSLYKVPDEASQALMTAFYRRLAAGEGKLAALNGAQREMIAARRQAHGAAHPYFWASFVLVGDPQ